MINNTNINNNNSNNNNNNNPPKALKYPAGIRRGITILHGQVGSLALVGGLRDGV